MVKKQGGTLSIVTSASLNLPQLGNPGLGFDGIRNVVRRKRGLKEYR